jgi:hypothetical protein
MNVRNLSSLVSNPPHSILFPKLPSLSIPNHSIVFPAPFSMTLLAAENDHHQGSTGADLAKSSTKPVSLSIVFSIGHHPIVSESLTNRRIINMVKSNIIS